MSPERPFLSVVVPAFNYARTLGRAVESVYSQMTGRHELIVIDDGSTDDTPAVAERLAASCTRNCRFIRKPNGGPSSARNLGIAESAGDYLIFLDADDEMLPGALARIEEHLTRHPDSCLVIGGHLSMTADGKQRPHLPAPLPDRPLDRVRGYLLDKTIAVSNGACAMHRSVFDRGRYPEDFRSTEDIPVFCQALANYPCSIIAEPLAIIHKHDDSLRHQLRHAAAVGLRIVDEVFCPARLGSAFQEIRAEFELQRCLSLFRTAYLGNDREMAKRYFCEALRRSWLVPLRFSYSRKALRLWLLPEKRRLT